MDLKKLSKGINYTTLGIRIAGGVALLVAAALVEKVEED